MTDKEGEILNKEEKNKKRRDYYVRNREKVRAYQQRYRKENATVVREWIRQIEKKKEVLK